MEGKLITLYGAKVTDKLIKLLREKLKKMIIGGGKQNTGTIYCLGSIELDPPASQVPMRVIIT